MLRRGDYLEKKNPDTQLQNLGRALSMSFRMVSNRIGSNFKSCDYAITPEQYTILVCLYNNGELQQNQLAKLTAKDEPSISRIINNMIKNGLVRRVPHPEDRRTNIICLTEEAKAIKEKLHSEVLNALTDSVKGLQDSDIENLQRMLNHIINNLKIYLLAVGSFVDMFCVNY